MDTLEWHLKEIHDFFELESKSNSSKIIELMYNLTTSYLLHYNKCVQLRECLLENSKIFDCNAGLEYNGYRTLIEMFEKCCLQSLRVIKFIYRKSCKVRKAKERCLTSRANEYKTWCLLIENFSLVFNIATEMQEFTKQTKCLFIHDAEKSQILEKKIVLLNSESFYGHSCAFQFCKSLRFLLTACTVAMVTVDERQKLKTQGQNCCLRKAAQTVSTSVKCLDQEYRANQLVNIMKNSNIDFFKSVVQLIEKRIVQVILSRC